MWTPHLSYPHKDCHCCQFEPNLQLLFKVSWKLHGLWSSQQISCNKCPLLRWQQSRRAVNVYYLLLNHDGCANVLYMDTGCKKILVQKLLDISLGVNQITTSRGIKVAGIQSTGSGGVAVGGSTSSVWRYKVYTSTCASTACADDAHWPEQTKRTFVAYLKGYLGSDTNHTQHSPCFYYTYILTFLVSMQQWVMISTRFEIFTSTWRQSASYNGAKGASSHGHQYWRHNLE